MESLLGVTPVESLLSSRSSPSDCTGESAAELDFNLTRRAAVSLLTKVGLMTFSGRVGKGKESCTWREMMSCCRCRISLCFWIQVVVSLYDLKGASAPKLVFRTLAGRCSLLRLLSRSRSSVGGELKEGLLEYYYVIMQLRSIPHNCIIIA